MQRSKNILAYFFMGHDVGLHEARLIPFLFPVLLLLLENYTRIYILLHITYYILYSKPLMCSFKKTRFLPRCMECRRGLTMRFLSVRLSVRLSVCLSVCQTRALWQNGRKICLDFYIIRKKIYPFPEKKNGWWGRPLLPEILGQPARVGAKSPILNR